MPPSSHWLAEQADLTFTRLLPRLKPLLDTHSTGNQFLERLREYFPDIFRLLHELYGTQYDFFYHLEQLIHDVALIALDRSEELRTLDQSREAAPLWFQSEAMMGAVCYVDRFADTLHGIREQIPYFRELGITYLHLMPLFKSPEANSDGGYAVSSFREVNPQLGTMAELAELARELRANGISLVLDFVFNHTSDEHDWAKLAIAGNKRYQEFYWWFEDRTLPDQYERHLREIFPEQAPGSFTWREDIQKWVWTTFYPFQWDLNYQNPDVFRAMLCEILFLANQGVEILRLDAVPFVWKRLGTNCENLPEAHIIIQALNALVRVAAPALLFKSEAIVHPRDVRSYISGRECQISYNPIMMVSIWEALATRETFFFRHTMNKQYQLPDDCTWINYLRSHDDIGWGFADEDAAEVGINGGDHRHFLNMFYADRFPGTFAKGLPFNYNPKTGDMRISGTLASLAGLERALESGDEGWIERTIARIVMAFGLTLSAGGIPLIYLGDEIGTLNDYSYGENPAHAADNRWVHRPHANAAAYARRLDPTSIEGRIYQPIKHLIDLRKRTPLLANGQTRFIETGNAHVLGFIRHNRLLVLANFTEEPQTPDVHAIHAEGYDPIGTEDLITGTKILSPVQIELAPYQIVWLERTNT